jgi:hypothetical protein
LSAEQLVLSIVQFGVDVGAHILLLLGDMLDLLVQLCLRPASSWRRQSYASVVLTTVRNVSPTNLQTDVGLLAEPADMPSALYEGSQHRTEARFTLSQQALELPRTSSGREQELSGGV